MSDDTDPLADRDRRIVELQAEIARSRVSHEFGVPIGLLGNAATEAEARAAAVEALAWRGEQAWPSRPTSAALPASTVSYGSSGSPLDGRIIGPPPIRTRGELSRMSAANTMAAWRAGMLEEIGGGPAKPQRNGAPVDRV
jgi:hypothetical protein